jgi:hypothetical protein
METTKARRKVNIVKPAPVKTEASIATPGLVEYSEPKEWTPDELRQKICEQEETIRLQKEQLEKKGAIPGWLITTPNPFYNGKTAGIKFQAGRGFIASRDENAEKKAKMLCDDFGYDRRFVEDFTSDPDMAEEVGGNLTEILLGVKNR